MFLKRTAMSKNSTRSSKRRHQYDGGPVGTEAVAEETEQLNRRHFKYPESGFVTRIEHTVLYTMIREPGIFPIPIVLQAIEEEDFSNYFYVRPKPKTNTVHYDVSYAQLTALLALAGEEWPHDSEIPPALCKRVSQCVLRYANEHNLDRKTELDELLQPLYKYASRREAKQSAKMLPWLIPALGATMITGNPIPFYAAFVASNLAESSNIEKGANSTANTDRMMDCGTRAANIEQASLLDEQDDHGHHPHIQNVIGEDLYNSDDENDVVIDL